VAIAEAAHQAPLPRGQTRLQRSLLGRGGATARGRRGRRGGGRCSLAARAARSLALSLRALPRGGRRRGRRAAVRAADPAVPAQALSRRSAA